jgi:Tfp pilus assembly protein PilF
MYMEGKYQEALQWYEGALKSPDKMDQRWLLYRLALCKMKIADGDAAKKNIATLKGGGEDPFWAKVADYMSDEEKRKEKYSRLAPN